MCNTRKKRDLTSSTDRHHLQLQSRLPNPDRHALPLLATDADPGVQRQIVADHGDLLHRLGSVADEGRPLEWRGDLAILDEIGLGSREDKLAGGDIHLAAAEEQSATSAEISSNMTQITTVVQEMSQGAEESASSASQLARMADEMKRTVASFTL